MEDAELARRAADGDQAAWAAIYDRYADRLHHYCASVVGRSDAADTLHDAFVTAATKIGQLRDADRLRPWLYAICRTTALADLRRRKREAPSEDLAEMTPPSADREHYLDSELAELVADAAGGLDDRERAVLDLHLHGLEGKELATALGVKPHHATVMLSRVRTNVERSLSALLVGRTGRRDCPDLAVLLSEWDGALSPLIRKRVARHIDGCETCGERKRRMVSPIALLSSMPMIPAPPELRDRVLDDIALVSATRGLDSGFASPSTRRWGSMAAAGAAAVVVLGGAFMIAERPWQSAVEGAPLAAPALATTTTASEPAISPPAPSPTTSVPPTTSPAVPAGEPTPARETTTTTTTTTSEEPGEPADRTAPVISDLAADRRFLSHAAPECASTAVSGKVVDDSPVEVTLHWKQGPPGSAGTEAAELSGQDTFTARVGPIESARYGEVTWYVVATDEAGNVARSDDQRLPVERTCTTPVP